MLNNTEIAESADQLENLLSLEKLLYITNLELTFNYMGSEANQNQKKFLTKASHDIRQPLNALSLYIDALTKQNHGDNCGLVKKIQHCVSEISDLLKCIVEISKLEEDTVKLGKTFLELDKVTELLAHTDVDDDAMKRIKKLTVRELEVMRLAIEGMPNKQIAKKLSISHRTVEIHKSKIMTKTGAINSHNLASIARAAGFDSNSYNHTQQLKLEEHKSLMH